MVRPAMDKSQLELAGLIHDLRNPLTAIVGHAQVLRLLLDRDGGGRNASGNNTLYAFVWLAF